jgi:hypothetical protein
MIAPLQGVSPSTQPDGEIADDERDEHEQDEFHDMLGITDRNRIPTTWPRRCRCKSGDRRNDDGPPSDLAVPDSMAGRERAAVGDHSVAALLWRHAVRCLVQSDVASGEVGRSSRTRYPAMLLSDNTWEEGLTLQEEQAGREPSLVLHVAGDVAPKGEAIRLKIDRDGQGPVDIYLRSEDVKYLVSLLLNLGCEARHRQAPANGLPPNEAIPLPLDAIKWSE